MKKLTGLIPLLIFGVVHGDIRKYPNISNFLDFSRFDFRDWFFTGYDSVKNYGFRETSRWCFSYLSTKGFDTFYGYGHLTRVCISWVYIGTGKPNPCSEYILTVSGPLVLRKNVETQQKEFLIKSITI